MTKTTLDENSHKIWEKVNGTFKLQTKSVDSKITWENIFALDINELGLN